MNSSDTPKHIAIIPDGNRRWAKERGLESHKGHQKAAEDVLPALIEKCADLGIQYFTFWVMSTENIKKRTPTEVTNLFHLMRMFLKVKIKHFKKNNIRLMAIGDLDGLPSDIGSGIRKAIQDTANNTRLTVVFAINYGGREELVRAVRAIAQEGIDSASITAETITRHLDTRDIPDPELIIRTGGEKRLSGFMLWQGEYAEYTFSDKYFPDWTAEELEKSVTDFMHRQRRFGK